ncbi:MAG: hypothetical protein JRI23_05255 [Deltaproteobacteria bacterium]|nr:hypothetical protein [Deltaproteobacteria bacterium]MBW2530959.1 hypothetical protein [Deltaproteobacteria bacterium]
MTMLALASTSCLVTSSPDFTPPERTRPEIVTNDEFGPNPAQGELVVFYPTAGEYSPVEFAAWVQSEDADQNVLTVLLIDYGDESGVQNGPWRSYVPGKPLPAGTFSQGPRGPVTINWRPEKLETPGCHTVTLLVTHEFWLDPTEGYWCPKDGQDASTLTWFVAVCETANPDECDYTNCPVRGQGTRTYCPGVGTDLNEGGEP